MTFLVTLFSEFPMNLFLLSVLTFSLFAVKSYIFILLRMFDRGLDVKCKTVQIVEALDYIPFLQRQFVFFSFEFSLYTLCLFSSMWNCFFLLFISRSSLFIRNINIICVDTQHHFSQAPLEGIGWLQSPFSHVGTAHPFAVFFPLTFRLVYFLLYLYHYWTGRQ